MPEAPRPSRGLVDTSVVIELDLVDAEQLPSHTRRAMPASDQDVKIAYSEPGPPSAGCHSMPIQHEDANSLGSFRLLCCSTSFATTSAWNRWNRLAGWQPLSSCAPTGLRPV